MAAPIFIPFGPFEPDAAHLNSGVLSVALRVYPASKTFSFAPAPASISSVSVGTVLGGVVIQTSSAGAYSLYYGTTNILRRIDSSALNSATTIATSTQPTAPAIWRFAKFGTKLIAVHAGVDALYEDWTAAAAGMSTLGGSPPRASGVFTIGDFVFLTGLASNARKLQWSAINNAEGWTVGTNLSDEQEFSDGGDVFGISGDKTGFVIQQNAIRTFQFLPGDTATIFQFGKVLDVPGCSSLNGWAAGGQSIFYYSDEGFCSIGPNGFRKIGAHRVDEYWKTKNVNPTYMRAVADPFGPRIFFCYDSEPDGGGDGQLIYDWVLDRWSEGAQGGFYFEHLDGTGGSVPIIYNGSLSSLSGRGGPASITTSTMELFQKTGQRSLINFVRPIVQAVVGSVSVSVRDQLNVSGTPVSATAATNGRWSALAAGTYTQFSLTASAANASSVASLDNAAQIIGLQVWATADGEV